MKKKAVRRRIAARCTLFSIVFFILLSAQVRAMAAELAGNRRWSRGQARDVSNHRARYDVGRGSRQEAPESRCRADERIFAFHFKATSIFGLGPSHTGWRYTLNIQPVIPISLTKDWNLISRTILPVISQHNAVGAPHRDRRRESEALESLERGHLMKTKTIICFALASLFGFPELAQSSSYEELANLPFEENRPTKETAQTLRDELLFQRAIKTKSMKSLTRRKFLITSAAVGTTLLPQRTIVRRTGREADLHHTAHQRSALGFIGMARPRTTRRSRSTTTRPGAATRAWPALIARRRAVRESEGPVLVLDAGDYSMGTAFGAAIRETGGELQLMSRMGYDATTFGNHDFDLGPDGWPSPSPWPPRPAAFRRWSPRIPPSREPIRRWPVSNAWPRTA